jgi:Rrf2 family cysteine metabolism transcriptional repressor
MRLSTKGRYGLRAMLEIALQQAKGPVPIHVIAENQSLSNRYLEQLLIPLKQNGLVKSVRGSQGGYILGREADKITVGDIIRALEGPISPVDCVNELNPDECERAEFCVTRRIWSELRDSINQVLDSYSLEDLKNEATESSGKSLR